MVSLLVDLADSRIYPTSAGIRIPNKIRSSDQRVKFPLRNRKRVLHVPNADAPPVHEHPDHIEPIAVRGLAEPVDPDVRGPDELASLSPVDRLHRIAELSPPPRFDLHEHHQPAPPRDEVEVAMAIAKAPVNERPAQMLEPLGGVRFAGESESLCRHGRQSRAGRAAAQAQNNAGRCKIVRTLPASRL